MSRALPSTEEAIRILLESGCSPYVISHCKAVAKQAVQLADKCTENGVNVNAQLVHVGALLHDIGRSRTHNVDHVVIGANLARSLNLPAPIVSIIERHMGGGITAEEASELGWPKKSYMPETIEEKIVAYADKLMEGSKVVPIQDTIRKLVEQLGADHPASQRVLRLHDEITALCQQSNERKRI